MNINSQIGVLFVCHANICRSPLAEALFAHLAAQSGLGDMFSIASAGTHAMDGAPPHPNSIEIGRRHGIAVRGASRQIGRRDLEHFDHILVMDRSNLRALDHMSMGRLPTYAARVELLKIAAGIATRRTAADVNDPIGRPLADYEALYTTLVACCSALLARL